MAGDVSVDDRRGAGAGADRVFPHGYSVVSGRVTSRVARVVVSLPGRSVTASVENGTFMARIAYPAGVPDSRSATVTAYDAAGTEIPVHQDGVGTTCYRTPGGYTIAGPPSATTCRPATRWPS